jgi:Ser/Thr protein kinase RdoA (MazF antagonist)
MSFQSLPSDRLRAKNINGDYRVHVDTIRKIEAAIMALPTQSEVDIHALNNLAARRTWLEISWSNMDGVQKRLESLPQYVLHGDFQETNLFFHETGVSAVIDWDQAGLAARGWEVVRALHLMHGLSPQLCTSFLAGYRSVLGIAGDELQEAAACYAVLSDNNLWVYISAYLEGNERTKQFIGSELFIPFQEQWRAANLRNISRDSQ